MPSTPLTRPSRLLWLPMVRRGRCRSGSKTAVVLREADLQRHAELHHVAGRRVLPRIGQAIGVAKAGIGHADGARRTGHAIGESRHGSRDVLGDDRGGIICRAGDEALDGILDGDRFAGPEAKLGRRLALGERGYPQRRRQLEPSPVELLEEDVERHHLGERGGIAPSVGVCLVEHLAGRRIDHNRRIF
jgi:hypothetical protein